MLKCMVNEKCRLPGETNTQRMSVFENFLTSWIHIILTGPTCINWTKEPPNIRISCVAPRSRSIPIWIPAIIHRSFQMVETVLMRDI